MCTSHKCSTLKWISLSGMPSIDVIRQSRLLIKGFPSFISRTKQKKTTIRNNNIPMDLTSLTKFHFCFSLSVFLQNPSQIPKTNFQCKGRPAGYYADIEAGESIYMQLCKLQLYCT